MSRTFFFWKSNQCPPFICHVCYCFAQDHLYIWHLSLQLSYPYFCTEISICDNRLHAAHSVAEFGGLVMNGCMDCFFLSAFIIGIHFCYELYILWLKTEARWLAAFIYHGHLFECNATSTHLNKTADYYINHYSV